MLKSYGVECAVGHVVMCSWPCGGGPCDFSVSPSPFSLNFGTLDFGTSDLGLTMQWPVLPFSVREEQCSPKGLVFV